MGRELRLPLLVDPSNVRPDSLPTQASLIATWRSREPSTSRPDFSRRIALAGTDNTVWITSIDEDVPSSRDTKGKARAPPQIIIPDTPTSTSPKSNPPSSSRPTRPSAGRASSYSGGARNRASSSASSILSSTSRRRSSALSPPPVANPLASVSATVASADPHVGHDHRKSDAERSELLNHLREQRDNRSSQDDARLGLGIGGLGRRGLSGVHSKDDIAEASGALSPRSARSSESSRNISARFMGWVGGEEAEQAREKERDRRELMEMVQEVEVEREMAREVDEERKEEEEEAMINRARRTPLGTPTIRQPGGSTAMVRRIIPREAARGRIVQLRVDEEMGFLLILRDIGILDIVSLTELCVVHSINLEESPKPMQNKAGSSSTFRMPPFWQWRRLEVINHGDESLLVIHGLPWPCGMPNPNGEITRVIMIRLSPNGQPDAVARLDLPGQGDVGLYRTGTETHLVHSSGSSLTSYPMTSPVTSLAPLPDRAVRTHTPQSRSVSAAITNTTGSADIDPASDPTSPQGESKQLRKNKSLVQLRDAADQPLLPYPPEKKERERSLTKFLAQRRAEKEVKTKSVPITVGWGIGEGQDIQRGSAAAWHGFRLRPDGSGIGFDSSIVQAFVIEQQAIRVLSSVPVPQDQVAIDCQVNRDRTVCLLTDRCLLIYDAGGDGDKGGEAVITQIGRFDGSKGFTYISPNAIIVLDTGRVNLVDVSATTSETQAILTFSSAAKPQEVASILPHDVETCFVADAAGSVSKVALLDILQGDHASTGDPPCSDRLESRITCMRVIGETPSYLVAGDEDGIVRIWNAKSFELQGSWSLFAFPVQSIALLDMAQAGSLQNHLFCVSQAGTVGIIALQEMEQLFLIPASRVALRRAFIGGRDIMLAYANGKTRVWNFETQEFRRSTGLDAAEEMLNAGDWAEIRLDAQVRQGTPVARAVPSVPTPSDLGRLVELDIRALSSLLAGSPHSAMDSSPLNTLRTILSTLIPFGCGVEIDRVIQEEMGIRKPSLAVVHGELSGRGASSLCYGEGDRVWRISAQATGTLQLAIVTLLRPFLDSPDHERWAAQLIAYYTASLPENAIQAGLSFFAAYYLDANPDIHQSARMLFGCRMDAMSEADIEAVADSHIAELPSFLPSADQHLDAADLALTMLGGMALHKYQSMPPSVLKAIAESVFIYLNSADISHLALAIELVSKGFTTWQTFVDPAEMLRRLFFLSTQNVSATATSAQNSQISAQARLAVLHVASSNPALFMSTLSMDILDARSAEGRKSIMKLCVYMARKRPKVLENSLPKVVEAVVKSLDPNVGRMREDVQQTATVILNELVLAFSTIDFNAATQKLAVGTHEGALIMYDLKTASRLYVLEPHRHPVSAVNFSPDGRRLITVSLEEGNLTVWKIGSSLSGFFNVGGPPQQGGKKGEPFKRMDFARADDVPLDSTSALSDVQISWPGTRQAKVVIKETAMTFET